MLASKPDGIRPDAVRSSSAVDIEQHLAALEEEGRRLADTAAATSLDTPIPTCPGWDVEALLRHLGGIHRWAALIVREGRGRPLSPDAGPIQAMRAEPSPTELVAWFRAGHAELLDVMRAAPTEVACWSFLAAPSPLAFWARRQAHETAVHRADVQLAARALEPYPPAFAADGIDEMLCGWMDGSRGRLQFGRAATLAVFAEDADQRWHVRLEADAAVASRDDTPADCELRGPAGDLYLLLWNRLPLHRTAISVSGDAGVAELWRRTVRI